MLGVQSGPALQARRERPNSRCWKTRYPGIFNTVPPMSSASALVSSVFAPMAQHESRPDYPKLVLLAQRNTIS